MRACLYLQGAHSPVGWQFVCAKVCVICVCVGTSLCPRAYSCTDEPALWVLPPFVCAGLCAGLRTCWVCLLVWAWAWAYDRIGPFTGEQGCVCLSLYRSQCACVTRCTSAGSCVYMYQCVCTCVSAFKCAPECVYGPGHACVPGCISCPLALSHPGTVLCPPLHTFGQKGAGNARMCPIFVQGLT